MTNKIFDTCTSFYIENGAFMGRLIRLNKVLKTILSQHKYPLNISSALAQTTTLAALCSAMLKFKGLFTLQIQGNGPVSLLVADITSEGKVRACAKFDEQAFQKAKSLRKTQDIIEEVPHLVGGGYMALTVDEQNGLPPYQGVVDLKGKNLTELALRYFAQSEQIPTLLKLFIKHPENEKQNFLGAGIILQKIPLKGGKDTPVDEQKTAHVWEDSAAFIESLKDSEVFDPLLSDEEILYRLFSQNNLQISAKRRFEFGCRCSREKLQKTLASFKEEEVEELFNENDTIEVSCNFCNQKYTFKRSEIKTKEKVLQ